tara:strand:- start:502 stop:1842 length:1341 start_codon:yes stop_codon:yes gene_type:complete
MLEINFKQKKTAVIFENKKKSYFELKQNILQVSLILKKKELKKKDVIFVNLDNSYFYILIYFACFINNFIIVPINKNVQKKEIKKLKKIIKPKLIISKEFDYEKINIRKNKKINFNIHRINSVFFSSGTTGEPKGIMHNYKSLINSAKNFQYLKKTKNMKFLSFLPMSYMAGFLNSIIYPLISNGTIIIKKKFDYDLIKNFFLIINQYKINALWATPTNIILLNKIHKKNKNKYLKEIFVGMAKLNQKDKLTFKRKFNIKCLESYGTSEALFISVKKNYNENSSSGNLVKNVNIKINDSEIIVCSNSIMAGYYLNEKSLSISKNNKFFNTGDLGYIKNGQVYITGRKKDLIIKGGENIYPSEIENILLKSKKINNTKVFGIEDEIAGEEIVIAIEPSQKKDQTLIREYICSQLKPIHQPKHILFVNSIPVNANGKIDTKKLKKFVK